MMKNTSKAKATLAALMAGCGMAGWTLPAHACDSEPFIASICMMALSGEQYQGINSTYVLAAGQTMQIQQYQALFALIGTTYGGDGQSTFKLPDLRGRVVVGYSPGTFPTGTVGGSAAVKLTVAQLPAHAMPITNLPVAVNGVTATTTTTGLSGTANLSGLAITGAASGLTLKGSSGTNGSASPAGKYLGKAPGAAGNLYSSTAPDVSLGAASIGGTLSLTVGQGVTAPVSIAGYATTTLSGNGVANGSTGVIGSNADLPLMQPYVVMPYYIAISGIFPSRD